MLANNLPDTDSAVMPRHLLQSPFGRDTIIPFLLYVGTALFCRILLNDTIRYDTLFALKN